MFTHSKVVQNKYEFFLVNNLGNQVAFDFSGMGKIPWM